MPDLRKSILFAFDKSVRSKDKDGVLHIAVAHICKAAVNPYIGKTIPKWQELGLDPNKVYYLFRDPDEMAKGVDTFNNKPVMFGHPENGFHVDDYDPEMVVGSTGSTATFTAPYIDNSLSIWDGAAISGVEDDIQREISPSYRYIADMTPGTYKGLRYDGVMRDIACNHVALVEAGRQGSDVIVGDAKPEIWTMAQALNSRKAILARGALTTYLTPLLAQDAKLDLSAILAPVTRTNFAKMKTKIVAGITKAAKGKLAQDADLDGLMEVVEAIQNLDDGDADEDDLTADADTPEPGMDNDGLAAFLKDKLSPEDHAKACSMMTTKAADADETPEEKAAREKKEKDGKEKPAMDAATIERNAEARARKAMTAIRNAEKDVRPYVGDLEVAMDSADDVYRFALDAMGVEHEGVTGDGLRLILKATPVPGATPPKTPTVAKDAKEIQDDFTKRFLSNAA